MATVADILRTIDNFAPTRWALPFDKVGLQLGRADSEIGAGIVSLDWSDELLFFAKDLNADLIVCHHPLIWDPLTSVDGSTRAGRFILDAVEAQVGFIACHTNWDAAPGGVSDSLAERLGLSQVSMFGEGAMVGKVKFVTFAPKSHLEAIIDALTEAGAGTIGEYERCAFVSPGQGTYRASERGSPYVGNPGATETVQEVRIEMTAPKSFSNALVDALLAVHPYEEPAYDLVSCESHVEMPLARIGELVEPVELAEWIGFVDERLATRCLAWGSPSKSISRVAVCGGAADSVWREALGEGADVLVTGEVKQNVAIEAVQAGMAIVAAGHYATEQPGVEALCELLQTEFESLKWTTFVPEPGCAGRPLA